MEEYRIKQIIEKLLKSQFNKKVLLILDKSDIYIDEVYKILSRFDNIEFEYIESEACSGYSKLEKIKSIASKGNFGGDIEDYLEKFDLVLVPFLSRNMLAKVSLGVADDIVSEYIQIAIMRSMDIVALDLAWNPNSESSRIKKINLNSAYNSMLLGYSDKLKNFGVKSVSLFDLEDEIKRSLFNELGSENATKGCKAKEDDGFSEVIDKKYITMKDVEGKDVLHISKRSKLTNLVQDYVLEKNIDIVER